MVFITDSFFDKATIDVVKYKQKRGGNMYIVKVLVEHAIYKLDTIYDYLSKYQVLAGCRVHIRFGYQQLVGYVVECQETLFTQKQLEEKNGFKYSFIQDVIDQKPLLNQELQELANYLSKQTLSTRISCLQCMLPPQLKPSTNHSVGIKYQKVVSFVKDIPLKTTKQQEALNYIKEHDLLPIKDYPFSTALLNNIEKQGAIIYKQVEVYRNPYNEHLQQEDYPLTTSQQKVVNQILASFHQFKTFLLYGVTGSGKTEVYLHLSRFVIEQGKTVLMLVPEIALTPMMVSAFKSRFGKSVAILHSKLSAGERYDEYRRIIDDEVKIVVGARSAVFAPLENIGLIIMDEEHDASYKQESPPRYLTSQVARKRGAYHQCPVVLGSATPSLESYSRALKGAYELCMLSQRVNQKPLPQIELIDMVEEMKAHHYEVLSRKMKAKIQETIDKNEQVILLLNKRGYSSYVRCLDCDEVLKCPHCDVSLTYHKDTRTMRCHYCDFQVPYQQKCSHCGSTNIKLIGSGTQKIEEYLQNNFINSRVIRYDVDSTRKKQGHHQLLKQFENQEANILIGTQMIAKGLDFENVTFVGVINADLSLNIPDFRANERTFQLLEQVSGRSGRGKKQGTVMIQTYNPDHFVLQCVKNHDYQSFYQKEMEMRKLAKYPPYCYLISILVQGKKEDDVTFCSQQIKEYLVKQLPKAIVLGPANCTIYKMNDIYRKRMTLKITNTTHVYEVLHAMSDYYNKKGRKVNVICDFNPYTTI